MLKSKQQAAVAAIESSLAEAAVEGRSPWADARVRFMRNKAAVFSLVLLTLITLACIIGPMVLPHGLADVDYDNTNTPPTFVAWHLFGTDDSGSDLLVRTLVGGRISLMVGALATIASVIIGVVWGAIAGYMGGKVDSLMMRLVDMMYAIPYLLIAILVVTLMGRDFFWVVFTITILSWMDMARVVRGQTLAIKSKEYIEAAHAIGVSTPSIIFRHVVPNLLGVVVIYTTVTVPGVILTESVLSFISLGVQYPMTSWGVLIAEGAGKMDSAPWMVICPGVMLSVTLYCANYIGDGMRDALDPKDR